MNISKYIRRVLRSSRVASIRQYWWNLFVNGVLMSYVIPVGFRRRTLNCLGLDVKGAVHGHCTLLISKLFLGTNSFINRNCFIDNNAMVKIGNNCAVGFSVVIATTNHSIECSYKRGGEIKPLPVEIHDGCWIGASCTILPGTIIHKGCVIAAGSVVKGVCEANGFYAGVPAVKKKVLL